MPKEQLDGMDRYLVIIRDTSGTDEVWSMTWWADDFGHAEEQTIDMLKSTKVDGYSKIIRIEKEFE